MTVDVRSYCRICGASCGIVVAVDGDRVLSVRGDREHPGSLGYTCPKGRALPLLHHSPGRLSAPRLRHAETPWDVVLDDLAVRLQEIIASDGADAVGAYLGTGLAYDTAGWIAANGWLRAIGSRRLFTPATVDNAPVLRAAEVFAGHPQANPLCDYDRARTVLIVGSNPVVSHGYGTATANPVVAVRRVQSRGGHVIVIDPTRTETATIADTHLQVAPGNDHLLLAWLVRCALEGPLPTDAMDTTTPDDRAVLLESLQWVDEAVVARAIGVDVPALQQVRNAVLREPGALAVWCGTGVTMGAHGLLAELLRWCLLAVTGSLDTEDGMRFSRGNAFALRPLRKRVGANGPGLVSRPELSPWLGQHPCVAMVDEIESDQLRALVVAGANPLSAFPDPNATIRALDRLAVLAVGDVVDNDLTQRASHVLALAGQLERSDFPMHEHVLARSATAHTAAVVPLGAARKPTWWVFATLTYLMTGQHLFGTAPDALTDDDVLALIATGSAIPFDTFRSAGPHGIEIAENVGWVRDALCAGAPWPIADPLIVDRLEALKAHQPLSASGHAGSAVATTPHRTDEFVVIPRRQMRTNNSVDDPSRSATPRTWIHPNDAATLGLVEGAAARIWNEHGEVVTAINFDARLRTGVIAMNHGDWRASPGALVSARHGVDPETGMPTASGFAVRVMPAEAPPRE